MHRISRKNLNYVMDGALEPVLRVGLPAKITYETIDAFGGQVKSPDAKMDNLDFSKVNPATGPVFFEGVGPGDVLAVRIDDLRVPSQGVMMCAPGAGLLKDRYETSEVKILPIRGGKIHFDDLELPLHPMIGVIGLAPAGAPINCGTPGTHGGEHGHQIDRQGGYTLPSRCGGWRSFGHG